jgi:hypothetical protein
MSGRSRAFLSTAIANHAARGGISSMKHTRSREVERCVVPSSVRRWPPS